MEKFTDNNSDIKRKEQKVKTKLRRNQQSRQAKPTSNNESSQYCEQFNRLI